jgi:hypothetical protein
VGEAEMSQTLWRGMPLSEEMAAVVDILWEDQTPVGFSQGGLHPKRDFLVTADKILSAINQIRRDNLRL